MYCRLCLDYTFEDCDKFYDTPCTWLLVCRYTVLSIQMQILLSPLLLLFQLTMIQIRAGYTPYQV